MFIRIILMKRSVRYFFSPFFELITIYFTIYETNIWNNVERRYKNYISYDYKTITKITFRTIITTKTTFHIIKSDKIRTKIIFYIII